MAEELGSRAAGLLVDEAWAAYREGRFQQAMAAASRAVPAAELLDDPALLVRALDAEAASLQLMGDDTAALARYTRMLGLAEDSSTRGRLDDPLAAWAVAAAYSNWVGAAQYVPGIGVRDLFGVLDAAERWLAVTGHRDWRAGVVLQRALVHKRLGEMDAAVAAAQEALALKTQQPNSPGATLNACRYQLAGILRDAGRPAEAVPQYQAVLADPAANPWDRRVAHAGLAWCALGAGDVPAGRREARAAVLLAESQGDGALCVSLDVLAEACRAAGDLAAAGEVASRYLAAARRVGGHDRPYYAVRIAADIALDRGDLDTVRALIGELDEHATALDAATGNSVFAWEAAQRRGRLAALSEPAS